MSKRPLPKSGEIYKHFKNKMYQIITVAEHTETGEHFVIYQALYDNFKSYARPADMFMSEVDHQKYPEVTQKYRFELIERDGDGNLKIETSVKENKELEEVVQIQKNEIPSGKFGKTETSDENLKEEVREGTDGSVNMNEQSQKTETLEKQKIIMEGSENSDVTEETGEINPLLLSFLDTDSYSEKLEVLVSIRSRLDDRLIDDMATALDITVEEGPLPKRYESLKTCLDAMVKFECGRLR